MDDLFEKEENSYLKKMIKREIDSYIQDVYYEVIPSGLSPIQMRRLKEPLIEITAEDFNSMFGRVVNSLESFTVTFNGTKFLEYDKLREMLKN